MNKVIIVWSSLNDMGFGLEVSEEDAQVAAHIAENGFSNWFDTENYPEYHDLGYAEPTEDILKEKGIEYRLLDEKEITNPYNEDEFIPDAKVIFI